MTTHDIIYKQNVPIGRKRTILVMQTDKTDLEGVWNPYHKWYERFDIIEYPFFLEDLEDYRLARLADEGLQHVCYVVVNLTKFDIAYEYYRDEFIYC